MPKTKKTTYGPAGTRMQAWLEQFDTTGCEPMVSELCVVTDRLAEIRKEMAAPGLKTMDRCHLISAENRVQGMLMRIWRQSGLGDDTAPKFGRIGGDDED